MKILRRFSDEYHGPQGLLVLAHILVSGFDTFQNAPFEVAEEHSKALHWLAQGKIESDRKLTALEISIISDSKNLLSIRPCQRVIDAIYQGTIVYTPTAFFEFLPDNYKYKSIGLYNPHEAPLLDQYRLVVPRNRYYLEIWHFIILLALYISQMQMRDAGNFTFFEVFFCVYTFGWLLDQSATILEHGWQVYTQNLWTYLDVSFGATFLVYFILRLIGHHTNDVQTTEIAFDVLAMGAPFLVPRLAFNILSENMLFVSLRAMMSNFIILTLLAVWSFAGFLLASSWVSRGSHSPWTIAKWMLWLWFGLDATGIEASPQFHWLLGPVLMISFAFLGNTLFLTILVSMLSNTFATLAANTEAEIQYRRTVITFEGVKSDALFSYPPPFNILALVILLPFKFILTPRYFHKVIVYSVRIINCPILLLSSLYERRKVWALQLPGWWQNLTQQCHLDNLGLAVHGDLHTVFEKAPPRSIYGSVDLGPLNDQHHLQVPGINDHLSEVLRKDSMNIFCSGNRKESVGPYHEVTEQLHELFQEHGGGKENQERFAHIESSIGRMESVFSLFCDRLDSIDASAQPISRQGSTVVNILARRVSNDYGLRRNSRAFHFDEKKSRRGSQAFDVEKEDDPTRVLRRRSSIYDLGNGKLSDEGRRGSDALALNDDFGPADSLRRRSEIYGLDDLELPNNIRRSSKGFDLVDNASFPNLSQRHSEGYVPDDNDASTITIKRHKNRSAGADDEENSIRAGRRRRSSSRRENDGMTVDDHDLDDITAKFRRGSQAFGLSHRRDRESLACDKDEDVCPIDRRGMQH